MDVIQKKWPKEKVFLHLDRPYYNIGDTIWFKAYVLDDASLSSTSKSGILYLDIYTDSNEVVRRISIRLIAGVGYAQIPLSDKIFKQGGHTLRAYTNWMQNFTQESFYERRLYFAKPASNSWIINSKFSVAGRGKKDTINSLLEIYDLNKNPIQLRDFEVSTYDNEKRLSKQSLRSNIDGLLTFNTIANINGKASKLRLELKELTKDEPALNFSIPVNLNRSNSLDLQFLPEGGKLIAGVKSVLGFKCIAENGKGVDISGELIDDQGKIVERFSTVHNGMGSFSFTPQTGKGYKARIVKPANIANTYKLPVVSAEGINLHLSSIDDADSIHVELLGSEKFLEPTETYYLICSSRNKIYFGKKLDPTKKITAISKNLFPSGIIKLTLFKGLVSVSERLTYNDRKDKLQVTVSTDKDIYDGGDSIRMKIQVRDWNGVPVRGSFSAAITDNSQIISDKKGEHDIDMYLSLTSDLKGYVETPGYYSDTTNVNRLAALDNLLLTQGWIGQTDKVKKAVGTSGYLPEKDIILRGTVKNLLNDPVKSAPVLISSQRPSFIKTVLTNELGEFEFDKLPPIDSGSFFIQARTPGGKTKTFGSVELQKFRPAVVPERDYNPMLPWYIGTDSIRLNAIKKNVVNRFGHMTKTGIMLNEVKIVQKKLIKNSENLNGSGNADIVYDEKDIKESAVLDLYDFLKQKLPGFKVIRKNGLTAIMSNDYYLIIKVDGAALPMSLSGYPTEDEIIYELREFKVATYKGLEVMYTRKYSNRYFGPNGNASGVKRFIPGETKRKNESPPILDENEYIDPAPGAIYGRYMEWRFYKAGETGRDENAMIIEITTGSGIGGFRNTKNDFVTYRPIPIIHPKVFYEPRYPVQINDRAPDTRATVFWRPDIITDEKGFFEATFFNSDASKNLDVIVQGTDLQGFFGSGRMTIKTLAK